MKIKNKHILTASGNGTKPKKIAVCYLNIYDANYMMRLAVYEINILPCMRVEGLKQMHLGIVNNY